MGALRWRCGHRLRVFLAPEELGVRAREHDRLPVAHLDDFRREPLDEIPIVGDEDERAAVIGEGVEQDVLRVEIQVIGRLVEQQRVRRAEQHARDGQPRSLAARQHAGPFVHIVAGEQEAAEDVADHRHHVHRRAVLQRVVHRQRRVEARGLVLRKVLHHHLVAFLPGAAVGRFRSGQHPHQRRLAGAVRADERDAVAPLDVQVQVLKDDEIAVRLADVLQLQDRTAALRAGGKREVDALPLGRDLDRHHLVEQLDAALHLRRLRGLVPEPVHEQLDARYLFVLVLLGLTELLEPRVALGNVMAVIARVVGDRPEAEVGDARHDRVQEEPIVRHEDDGVRVLRQIPFEPVAGIEVEVIRRLVEQQQARLLQQQLGQGDAHLPTARERFGGPLRVRL